METRAHYVAVGAFVLTMIVLAFAAVLWLARAQLTTLELKPDSCATSAVKNEGLNPPFLEMRSRPSAIPPPQPKGKIALLRAQGETVNALIAADADEVLGCNTRADLAEVDLAFRRRKRAELMAAGVSRVRAALCLHLESVRSWSQ